MKGACAPRLHNTDYGEVGHVRWPCLIKVLIADDSPNSFIKALKPDWWLAGMSTNPNGLGRIAIRNL